MIAKESAALRKAFKEQDSTYRHRCRRGAGIGPVGTLTSECSHTCLE